MLNNSKIVKVGPDFKRLPFTILGWEVSDIETIVPEMKNRGVAAGLTTPETA